MFNYVMHKLGYMRRSEHFDEINRRNKQFNNLFDDLEQNQIMLDAIKQENKDLIMQLNESHSNLASRTSRIIKAENIIYHSFVNKKQKRDPVTGRFVKKENAAKLAIDYENEYGSLKRSA